MWRPQRPAMCRSGAIVRVWGILTLQGVGVGRQRCAPCVSPRRIANQCWRRPNLGWGGGLGWWCIFHTHRGRQLTHQCAAASRCSGDTGSQKTQKWRGPASFACMLPARSCLQLIVPVRKACLLPGYRCMNAQGCGCRLPAGGSLGGPQASPWQHTFRLLACYTDPRCA